MILDVMGYGDINLFWKTTMDLAIVFFLCLVDISKGDYISLLFHQSWLIWLSKDYDSIHKMSLQLVKISVVKGNNGYYPSSCVCWFFR